MRLTQILNEQEIKDIIAKKFCTSMNDVFINAVDENGKITIQVDYDIIVIDDECKNIG